MLDILHPTARIYKEKGLVFWRHSDILNAIKPPAPSCRMGMPMGLRLLRRYSRSGPSGFSSLHPGGTAAPSFKGGTPLCRFSCVPIFPRSFPHPHWKTHRTPSFARRPWDGVAPENFHAMSIFPEYFKSQRSGIWPGRAGWTAWPWDRGRIDVREFRRLRRATLVAVGRTEQGEEGILVHPDGFRERRVPEECLPSGRAAPGRPPFPGTMTSSMNCCATNGTTARWSG